jgi:hypothetical protein
VRSTAEQLTDRLQSNPHDAEAYDGLRKIYRDGGDLASLTNLVEGWAGFQTDPVLASRGYLEAARSSRAGGGHATRTRELLHKALERDVTLREAAEDLVALLAEARDVQALAEFLDAHLRRLEARGGEPAFMAELYTRLGDLWRVTFKRPEVAAPCYQRAQELDPLRAVPGDGEVVSPPTGDPTLTARLYVAEAESETDPARKSELFVKLAKLYESVLADPDAAVRALRSALTATPNSVSVMSQLANCLTRRAAARPGEEAERDKKRVAELHYQIAQAVPPEDAIEYLEASLYAMPLHEAALHMLEDLAPRLGKELLLPRHWVNFLAQAPDGANVDPRRVRLARAYMQAGQIEDAIYTLEQAAPGGPAAQLLEELRTQRGGSAGAPLSAATAAASAARAAAPPPVRARKRSSAQPADGSDAIRELQRAIHDAIAARDAARAATHSRELLTLAPGEPAAFMFLESHYRKTRDAFRLRELLLSSIEVPGVSLEVRKQRMREVAALSETKLKDVADAIEIYRDVVALDPADADAGASLKRLLSRTQRWDELASVLEREAAAAQDTTDRVALLGQIVSLHRDKRKDLREAAEALRQLLALAPTDSIRDELCDLLLSIGDHVEAVPLLRERIESATQEREKLQLLERLAQTLDEQQGDPESAYDVCAEILALRPKDSGALARMEQIDERTGNVARLLATLERRAALAPRTERPELLARMASLAERQLDDVERAAEYYTRALDLVPGDEPILDALCEMFDRRERHEDLVELLKTRTTSEKDPARRLELERRRARVLREHLARDDEAAEAYRRILAAREDEESLRFLLEYARQREDGEGVAELTAGLARVLADPMEKRALLLERARVLRDDLEKPREAARTLREIVEHVDPDHDMAISELSELCERLGDAAGLSVALRRKHARTSDPQARAAIAQRLADLCEHELRDANAAIEALTAWSTDDQTTAVPRRRLVKLLLTSGRNAELVASYDALSRLEETTEARTRAALDAARLGFSALKDSDGAFARLGPLVEAGDEDAFEALAPIAQQAGRSAELAALCVTAAQRAPEPKLAGRNWRAAALVYAERLGNYAQALEAALRMLATDLGDRGYLGIVEEYVAHERAWPRLAQVYERLLKMARDDAERVELLVRQAIVLDERAEDASEAFNRMLRACALFPQDESLLARAEDLAKRADRGEEVLALYDARRHRVADAAGKLDISLRAARLCDGVLEDRPRANAYLKAALSVSGGDLRLWERVVLAAEALDHNQRQHGGGSALRALIHAHRELAEKAGPELGPQLILRADGLLRERLRDDRTGFDVLRQGVTLYPSHDDIYEALFERATALGRLDALDSHLSQCIDKALDPQTAATLLARRATLLEGHLGRPQQAIEVLTKLLQLRPEDSHAATRLRRTLRKARRFPDLLLAIHKQLQRVKQPDERLVLIKESANIWEGDLRNRFEARDAWRKALELAPSDAEAAAGLARTEQRLSVPHMLSEPPPPIAEGDEPVVEIPRDPPSEISVPLWDGEQPPTQEIEQPPMAAEDERSQDVEIEASQPLATGEGAQTVAGGFLAPNGPEPGEDTKDIDVDLDVLPPEDELDFSVEVPLSGRSIAPRGPRSAPPPPPRSALSSLPPAPRNQHVAPPKTSRPPPPRLPGRKV